MDRLDAMTTLVAAVDAGSLSGASRALGMPLATVSRKVSDLEQHLRTQLLIRSSRRLTLTEAGAGYFERVGRALADLEDADLAVGQLQAAPRGRLRVSAPMSFGFLHLAAAIPDFLALYPEVVVDCAMSDRFVDLVEEGFDIAVRIGALEDSSLIARRLAPVRRVVCASPDYIARRGRPETPSDLEKLDGLTNSNFDAFQEWRFVSQEGKPWPIEMRGRFGANNGDALRVAALRGLGFAYLPTFIVGADLRSGALVSVLEDFIEQDMFLSAVYPHARHLSPKVRALVDFLARRFGPRPYWDEA